MSDDVPINIELTALDLLNAYPFEEAHAIVQHEMRHNWKQAFNDPRVQAWVKHNAKAILASIKQNDAHVKAWKRNLYNVAQDYVINEVLLEGGITL